MSEDTIEVETKFAGDDEIHARTTVSEGTDKIVITIEDAIPIAELEELATEWYRKEKTADAKTAGAYLRARRDLSELIEEHKDE